MYDSISYYNSRYLPLSRYISYIVDSNPYLATCLELASSISKFSDSEKANIFIPYNTCDAANLYLGLSSII